MSSITDIDTKLLLNINGSHTPFWDDFMIYTTDQKSWIWLFAVILISIIYFKKKDSFWTILPLIVAIVIADHTASSLFKPLFERFRPCHDPELQHLLYQPIGFGCGGKYGFFSSHATNSFALSTFLMLTLKKKYKFWAVPMFVWAILFSFSRIYLAKHFPSDVIVGAIVGTLISWGVFNLFIWVRSKYFLTK